MIISSSEPANYTASLKVSTFDYFELRVTLYHVAAIAATMTIEKLSNLRSTEEK